MGERVAVVWHDGGRIIARDYDHWGDGQVIPRLKAVLEIWDTAATHNTASLRTMYYTLLGIIWHCYGKADKLGKTTILLDEYKGDPKEEQGDLQRIYHVKVENGTIYVKVEDRIDWSADKWKVSRWKELHAWLKNEKVTWVDWEEYVQMFHVTQGILSDPERVCTSVKCLLQGR